MKKLITTTLLSIALSAADTFSVKYPGGNGPGKGKHVVLIAGASWSRESGIW